MLMCSVVISDHQCPPAAAAAVAASETAFLTLNSFITCCKVVVVALVQQMTAVLICPCHSEIGQHAFVAAHRAHTAVNMQHLMLAICHSSQACTAVFCLAGSLGKSVCHVWYIVVTTNVSVFL